MCFNIQSIIIGKRKGQINSMVLQPINNLVVKGLLLSQKFILLQVFGLVLLKQKEDEGLKGQDYNLKRR